MTLDMTQVVITLIITLPSIINSILHRQTADQLACSVPPDAAKQMAESVPAHIATALAAALTAPQQPAGLLPPGKEGQP